MVTVCEPCRLKLHESLQRPPSSKPLYSERMAKKQRQEVSEKEGRGLITEHRLFPSQPQLCQFSSHYAAL